MKYLTEKPEVLAMFQKLNHAQVRWLLCSGSQVALLTESRDTKDIDIMVHDDDFEAIAQHLPTAERYDARVVVTTDNLGEAVRCRADRLQGWIGEHEVDVVGRPHFLTPEGSFYTGVTDFAYEHRLQMRIAGTTVHIAHPFDTILLKAFMRRGADQNKHDLRDAHTLVKQFTIDPQYVRKRVKQTGLTSEARQFLRQLCLI